MSSGCIGVPNSVVKVSATVFLIPLGIVLRGSSYVFRTYFTGDIITGRCTPMVKMNSGTERTAH